MRTVFVDELPMPKRPLVDPYESDREVFAQQLPVHLRNEEKLREWLGADFGPVEYVFLLKDRPDGEPNGKAYIRFQRHDSAALYIEVEGANAATWSESERARQRSRNVYGSDIYAAFFGSDGHILPSLVSQAGVRQLWASSEVKPPRGVNSPFKARQLHFFAECTEREFQRVRSALGDALRTFHEQTAHFAQAQDHLRRGEMATAQPKRKPGGPQTVSWDPATGKYVEEDLPADVQELINNSGGQRQAPPAPPMPPLPGTSKGGPPPPGKGGCPGYGKGGEAPPSKGGCPGYGKGGEAPPSKGGCPGYGKGGEAPCGKGGEAPYGKGGEVPYGKGGCQAPGKGCEPMPGKGGEPGKGACKGYGYPTGGQPFDGKGCGKPGEVPPGKGGELPGKGGCPGKGGEQAFGKGAELGRPRLPQPVSKGGKPFGQDGGKGRPDGADDSTLEIIGRGEGLVKEGRLLAKQGQVQQATERYREGLRLLMRTVPEGADEHSANISEADRQRLQRIGDYMSEMEALSVAVPQVPVVPAVMGAGAGAGNVGVAGDDGSSRRSRKSRWN